MEILEDEKKMGLSSMGGDLQSLGSVGHSGPGVFKYMYIATK